MSTSNDIAEFLASRRARITPEQAGLPSSGLRRVPGLRREEVAALAGMGIDYYRRLERGNVSGVSDSVLEALARALQLDDAERAHLFHLARAANPVLSRRRRPVQRRVRPVVQSILDAIGAPALIRNPHADYIAANPLGRANRSRPLRDLRISVTDRCNFRCTYCMPKEIFGRDYTFLPRAELLTFEEITRLGRAFASEGVSKIRLTGGEPLLRRDLEHLVAMLANVDGITDIALTTNGSALAANAQTLKDAGLNRVTVSLDALQDDTFAAMNDVDFPVARVLAGIDAAAAAALTPIKVNMVVKRGVSDHSIVHTAERFRGSGHILRFIEYMDVGATNGWRMDDVFPAAEIISAIERHWPLEPIEPNYSGEVATRYRYCDGAGEIGVIASVTQPFCGACTRARLSADGKLYTCLFAAAGHDLRSVLRQGASDEALTTQIRSIWRRRADRYSEQRRAATPRRPKIEMSYIGG